MNGLAREPGKPELSSSLTRAFLGVGVRLEQSEDAGEVASEEEKLRAAGRPKNRVFVLREERHSLIDVFCPVWTRTADVLSEKTSLRNQAKKEARLDTQDTDPGFRERLIMQERDA